LIDTDAIAYLLSNTIFHAAQGLDGSLRRALDDEKTSSSACSNSIFATPGFPPETLAVLFVVQVLPVWKRMKRGHAKITAEKQMPASLRKRAFGKTRNANQSQKFGRWLP
jgi:hypothetical protein